MIHDDIKQLLSLSAQADRLSDLHLRKRITEDEYTHKLAELRQQCDFQAVKLDDAAWGS